MHEGGAQRREWLVREMGNDPRQAPCYLYSCQRYMFAWCNIGELQLVHNEHFSSVETQHCSRPTASTSDCVHYTPVNPEFLMLPSNLQQGHGGWTGAEPPGSKLWTKLFLSSSTEAPDRSQALVGASTPGSRGTSRSHPTLRTAYLHMAGAPQE